MTEFTWLDNILLYFRIIRCEDCGKWVRMKKIYIYTNYGGCRDIDPPDSTYCCKWCTYEINPEYVWIQPRKYME